MAQEYDVTRDIKVDYSGAFRFVTVTLATSSPSGTITVSEREPVYSALSSEVGAEAVIATNKAEARAYAILTALTKEA